MSDTNSELTNSSKFTEKETLEEKKEVNKAKSEKRKDDIGKLGALFGSSKNAPTNISGVLILLLILFGIGCSIFFKDIENIEKIWANIAPIITLSLGYIFGKQQ